MILKRLAYFEGHKFKRVCTAPIFDSKSDRYKKSVCFMESCKYRSEFDARNEDNLECDLCEEFNMWKKKFTNNYWYRYVS